MGPIERPLAFSTRIMSRTTTRCSPSSSSGIASSCRYYVHRPNLGRGYRLYHATMQASKQPSILSRMYQAWKNVLIGDDHLNPRKILERRYLYFALLATHFRKRRISLYGTTPIDDAIKDTLYEQTVQELAIDKKAETTTNVDLRRMLQIILVEQVQEITSAFAKIDAMLSIPFLDNAAVLQIDLSRMQSILMEDLELTQRALEEKSAENKTASVGFLETKRDAILLLSKFHGWSTLHSPTTQQQQEQSPVDAFGMQLSDAVYGKEETLRTIRFHQTVNLCRSALIRRELGYSVLALRSCIPNAGRGLFVDGSAVVGSLLAFQPGDVWPKEHLLTDAPDVVDHFDDGDEEDCQVSLRFDEYVVDARQSPVTVLSQEGSLNPWALAHMANHPAPGMQPNSQSTMLNYFSTLNEKVRYVPNTYARLPSWKSKFFDMGDDTLIMHGLSLLAKRNVELEEVVYDYRIQSNVTPDWYHVVRYDDGMEQEQVVFFRDDWKKKREQWEDVL